GCGSQVFHNPEPRSSASLFVVFAVGSPSSQLDKLIEQTILFPKIVAMAADLHTRFEKSFAHGAILLSIEDLPKAHLSYVSETLHSAPRHTTERYIAFPIDEGMEPRHEAYMLFIETARVQSRSRHLHFAFGSAERIDEIIGSRKSESRAK